MLNPESSSTTIAPTAESLLTTLTQARLLDLARSMGMGLRREERDSKRALVPTMAARPRDQIPTILREMGREELRAACRAHGVAHEGRARRDLQIRLLEAAGIEIEALEPPRPPRADGLPAVGDVVSVRHRHWLVEEVVEGAPGESARVRLSCLDDDAPGRILEVLWDLELGARILTPSMEGLGRIDALDPPQHFGAYLHALKWSAVSAADATRFQAPFRAGIKLMAHQLTPLMKALELPRANLFIADDVGLGKTIEAGLVLQELLLRQQADFVLIACPASICLQWKAEMQRRFGLRFEVMTRQFVSYRRQERGFGVNPWATHNRFIISHSLLRRPEYRDPLIAHLGPRARKGLLILDEAHVAAPATRSKYAVDSDITRAIRDLAPRFDNRLFLSATPHNGHSNSFSALLEILDPVRFTRGVPVSGKEALAPIMVRRLKRDLRQLGVENFPRRLLVQHRLEYVSNEGWERKELVYDSEKLSASEALRVSPSEKLDGGPDTELRLAELLARYTELSAPKKGRGRLPFIRLQQRLLSSPEAFARTLERHAESVLRSGALSASAQRSFALTDDAIDPELHGLHDDAMEAEAEAEMARASSELLAPAEEARAILDEMRTLAENARRRPDAKVRALLAWMRANLHPGIGLGEGESSGGEWSDRRVILFTEWADTMRYLQEILSEAVAQTGASEGRIRVFHGGMGDEARDELQRAFNSPPDRDPVRILIATDAAREGINLQAHCADLFHMDLPWNPARLEQRNGRIDRTLQPSPEVRCHYFVYPQRVEDRILETLVRKVEIIQTELGSLGAVLLDEVERSLEGGLREELTEVIEAIGKDTSTQVVEEELEAQRDDLDQLRTEVMRAGRLLDASKRALEVDPESLRGVVEVGLEMAGAEGLREIAKTDEGAAIYELPALDRSWARTLDTLRPPRERGEAFYEWRRRAPRPVTFAPLGGLTDDVEQLHLAHPLVRRVLDRFLAQGFGAHDLSRVTALIAPDDSVVRVVAYARLSLFGNGASRLHDEIIAVAAPWSLERPDEAASLLEPYRDRATAVKTIERTEALLARGARAPSGRVQARIREHAPDLMAALWSSLEAEADARAVEAKNGLAQRARREASELEKLLVRQREAIEKAMRTLKQGELFAGADEKTHADQRRQVRLDLEHMEKRLRALEEEFITEPKAIEALYEVRMRRLSPIGLVVSWPEAMA